MADVVGGLLTFDEEGRNVLTGAGYFTFPVSGYLMYVKEVELEGKRATFALRPEIGGGVRVFDISDQDARKDVMLRDDVPDAMTYVEGLLAGRVGA